MSDTTAEQRQAAIAEIIEYNGSTVFLFDADLLDDMAVMMEAVQRDGILLRHASTSLKAHPAVVLAAVEENGLALLFADTTLQDNAEIVLRAVQKNGRALQYASSALRGNGAIVLAAVRSYGAALQYAAVALRGQYPIVLAAVQQCGQALQYVDMTTTTTTTGSSTKETTTTSPTTNIILAAVQQDGCALQYVLDHHQTREMVLAAVRQNPRALRYAASVFRSDEAIVRTAIQLDGCALQFATTTEQLQRRSIVVEAVTSNHRALQFVSSSVFWEDPEIVAIAMEGFLSDECTRFRDSPDSRSNSIYTHPWRDDRVKHLKDRLAAIKLPAELLRRHGFSSSKATTITPACLALQWLSELYHRARCLATVCEGVTPVETYMKVVQYAAMDWREVSTPLELGECSRLLLAVSSTTSLPWWEWLENNRKRPKMPTRSSHLSMPTTSVIAAGVGQRKLAVMICPGATVAFRCTLPMNFTSLKTLTRNISVH